MNDKTPHPLFNFYMPLWARVYCTIWPPKIRAAIGVAALTFAIKLMQQKRHFFCRNGAMSNAGFVYDYISETRERPWWASNAKRVWIALLIAVKILMIRNISRDGIIYQTGQVYDALQEKVHESQDQVWTRYEL